jgi:hypothetical protein
MTLRYKDDIAKSMFRVFACAWIEGGPMKLQLRMCGREGMERSVSTQLARDRV